MLIGCRAYSAVIMEIQTECSWSHAEVIGEFGHRYIQGERSTQIEVLILEKDWPSDSYADIEFKWENKDV
jgi:hypothetical protein